MRAADLAHAAVWSLRSRPVRTAALVTALAAGIAATVFVATVVAGFGREIDRLAFGAYARATTVGENVMVLDRHGPPNLGDRARLAAELEGYDESAAWKSGRAAVFRDSRQLEFAVYGVLGAYHHELDSPIVAGRDLTPAEVEGYARVCLLGADVAADLKTAAPIGQTLRIGGVGCEIVGVLGEPQSRPAARYADAVIAPLRAAERYFLGEDTRRPGEVDHLTVFIRPGEDLTDVEMDADLLLRKLRGAPLSQPSPFVYGENGASIEEVVEQRRMLGRLLSTLAGLSLIASMISFAAIGAATLVARRREIALRMAVGATVRDIVLQVVAEKVLTGTIGGVIGLGAGVLLAWSASKAWQWPFAPDLLVAAWALVLGTGVGLLVGVGLARQAASVPPSLAAKG